MPQSFSLSTEYIDLLQFLKATGIAMTGGEAKAIVDEGLVTVSYTHLTLPTTPYV